jgi:DNA sulfur modification protein DndC
MKYRKAWLEKLLKMEKDLRDDDINIELIKRDELHAIRQEWLRDPNEPDWQDSVPLIYSKIYPDNHIEWVENDAGAFTKHDEKLLKDLENKFDIPAELIMKLIEVEISMSGIGKRHGILNKLENVLSRDWDSLEKIKERKFSPERINLYEEKITDFQSKLGELN